MLGPYIRRMRNNNLEIRIVGSSCRPQWFITETAESSGIMVSFGGGCPEPQTLPSEFASDGTPLD